MTAKTAVVLFNLGGPDSPAAVRPFLVNLFSDPAIIGAPWLIRWLLARRIAARRAKAAGEIYRHLGGGSPLLANTEVQARALEKTLGSGFKVFISMRYWAPRAPETARAVRDWGAERVVLLPLYPQFSTTTTASSVADWGRAARAGGLSAPSVSICCYPSEAGFIEAIADLSQPRLDRARRWGPARVLFSAHGLPEKIIQRGDPYQWQVEAGAAAAAGRLGLARDEWVVCYQSRVGPLQWIGPSTEDEIARAGAEKRAIVVVPIAFVSEHSETLVELDIDYAELADKAGAPLYLRVPTVSTHEAFIAGLARLTCKALTQDEGWIGGQGRICPAGFSRCPLSARQARLKGA
ncbi:MAG: ferrochelatase [Alphaproteobacteria bacterium]